MIEQIKKDLPQGYQIYERSLREQDESVFTLVKDKENENFLCVHGDSSRFKGTVRGRVKLCPLTVENALVLKGRFPWLSPRRIPAGKQSFGFGDRLGLATPGHIRAFKNAEVFPILAQQSVRENARTGRNFAEVLSQAVFGAFQEGYTGGFGADADHLKRMEDALEAAELGYTFFTCDPSEHVVAVEKLPSAEVKNRFSALERADEWRTEYLGQNFSIPGIGKLTFTEDDLARAIVKYGRAVGFATEMYRVLSKRLPDGFDYEVSVDETETPTSRLEHLFVARELERAGVELKSLAPRFVG
ncbi:MAG: tagaturonate epimerase family protein, partial [candidate division WOR-3 bacterium]|nr:tagaturonate epimerase family protein [candidate division WOR-3 bacterium]